MNADPLYEFLKPTRLINSDHPDILRKSDELTSHQERIEDKARSIFYFIRDEISYDFRATFNEDEYLASSILKAGGGFCTQKAILFCALARRIGIPAGIHFYDIIDYTLPEYIINIIKTQTLYHHGIAVLQLNGQWHRYDATLDKTVCSRKNRIPVEFFPDRDCLMKSETYDGDRHIEYIRDYGMVSDVSFGHIVSWLRKGYPHLFD